MSYNNLSKYDKSLLENISNCEKIFYCSDKIEYDEIASTKINKIFDYNDKKGINKVLSYLKSYLKIINYIRVERPQLIHFQWFKLPHFDYILINIIKWFYRTKVIFTAHNLLPHNTEMAYYKIFKRIYSSVDVIIVHSQRTKQELVDLFKISEDYVHVIPHGILESTIESSKNNSSVNHHEHDQTGEIIRFSFLGYLSPYKGIDLLIEAWLNSDLLNKSQKVHLTIAGKGEVDFKGIEQFDNVSIINRFLEEKEFNQIIDSTDVVVMPYRKISQSGVLLSILEKKKPILVSDVGGLTEPFMLGDIGWILEKISAENLQLLLEEISDQNEKIANIKNDEELWGKIKNYYDWSRIGKKTESLYEEIKNSKPIE